MRERIVTRPFEEGDLPFVESMLISSCFRPGAQHPSLSDALKFPHAARWLDPPTGEFDIAVVAEMEGAGRVGAAVGRRFSQPHASWGVVSPTVPELALAVVAAHRRTGVGRVLLNGWLHDLKSKGFGSASLTVSTQNTTAVRLYLRAGFREIIRDDRRTVMLIQVGPI